MREKQYNDVLILYLNMIKHRVFTNFFYELEIF